VFGLFGLMFALFVFSGTSRLRQNGAWNEPRGANGVLSIVASLFFWGRAVQHEPELRFAWEAAVGDVVWMLEGMATYYEMFKGKF
jgi:hypothetical protein